MSDNRGSEVMLYFTDEVFCRLANQRTQNINDLGAMAVSFVFDLCRNVHFIALIHLTYQTIAIARRQPVPPNERKDVLGFTPGRTGTLHSTRQVA